MMTDFLNEVGTTEVARDSLNMEVNNMEVILDILIMFTDELCTIRDIYYTIRVDFDFMITITNV